MINFEVPQTELDSKLEEAISIFDEAEKKPPEQVRELSASPRKKMGNFVDQKLKQSTSELSK